jgi:hypothetical protein
MKETIVSKVTDLLIDQILKLFVYVFRVVAPIKITPKVIMGSSSADAFKNIIDVKIENRLNCWLYDIYVVGVSRIRFDLKIVSDDSPKGKTVEHMNINTNHLVAYATDTRNGNYSWIFRIHKFGPREILNLRVKADNKETIYLKLLQHSRVDVPIKERDDGVVQVPWTIKEIPKL